MFTPPLGLAYVAGTVRAGGHDVSFIDGVGEALDSRHEIGNECYLYGLSLDDIVKKIPANVEVIGVACGFSFEWPTCRDLIAGIRKRFPEALLIGGGEHVTAVPVQSMEESELDLGVLGEGEETALEIVNAFAAGNIDKTSIEGIVYKDTNGKAVSNTRRARKRDLDSIPVPAWDITPIENYLERGFGFGVDRGRSMPLMASRGCPYQCTFCSNPSMWTTRWIPRNPDLLLDEIEAYQEKYKAVNFDFYDLTAIVKKDWIVDFCHKIEERGLTFTWQLPSGTRSEAIDDEVAGLLFKSGCRNLSYSPESGSPSVLARIKKKITTDSVIESISSSFSQGMNVKCNIIFGFPGETLKEVFESYRFIMRMGIAGAYDISVWAFSPYPGSELFEQIREEKGIVLDDKYYDSLRSYADASRTVSYSENFSDKKLKALRWFGVALFYSSAWLRRPLRPFRMVLNVMRGTQESRSEMALANMLRRKTLSEDA
ncbi:MAG: B12-binding domain-containing radical SAM protein [Rhodospirillales bacterium]|nr:B12-binding domain-containing radical SAM protein [Rhodospirillales bacterium]